MNKKQQIPLTDEQRQLVEDNVKLVPWTINRFGLHRASGNAQDTYCDGYEGLCRAAARYNPERGTFSTYATTSIRKWILRKPQYANTKGRAHYKTMVSLDKLSSRDVVGRADTFLDMLTDGEDVFREAEIRDVVRSIRVIADKVLNDFPPIARTIYDHYIDGKRLHDVGKIVGRSRTRCEQYVGEINKRIRVIYFEKEKPNDDETMQAVWRDTADGTGT